MDLNEVYITLIDAKYIKLKKKEDVRVRLGSCMRRKAERATREERMTKE